MKNSIKLVLSIFVMVLLNFNAKVFAQNPGQVDTSFNAANANVPATVRIVFPTNDGKLLVASGDASPYVFYRLNSDGSLDTSFNNNSQRGMIMGLDTTDDGNIFITVNFNFSSFPNGFNGAGTFLLSKDNYTVLDSTELYYTNGSAYFALNTVKFISHTQFPILNNQEGVVFYGYTYGNHSFVNIFDLSPLSFSSSPVLSVSLPLNVTIKTINVSDSGKLYVGTDKGLYRYTIDTIGNSYALLYSDDVSFNNIIASTLNLTSPQCDISTIKFQSGGNTLLIGGTFQLSAIPAAIKQLCRLNNDGTLDLNFNIPSFSNGSINNITVTDSDKIFAVGAYGSPNFLIGLNANGTPDVVFNNNLAFGISSTNVKACCKTKAGNLIAGGQFSSCGGVAATNIVSLFGYDNTASGLNICIVTVDSSTGKNVIVWNKDLSTNINTYNIWKEVGTNIYDSIGSVSYNALSLFVDTLSNPNAKSEKYKINITDLNNNQTPLSSVAVKSILLTVNVGLNNDNILNWNEPEGFVVVQYYIYRSVNAQSYLLIDSVSNSALNTYDDLTPPLGNVAYIVQASNPGGCIASVVPISMQMILTPQNYNGSFSNIRHVGVTGIQNLNGNIVSGARVYPNPVNKNQTVTFQYTLLNNSNVTIQLVELTGKVVKEMSNGNLTKGDYKNNIDVSNISAGMYFVQVVTNSGKSQFKLIIQ